MTNLHENQDPFVNIDGKHYSENFKRKTENHPMCNRVWWIGNQDTFVLLVQFNFSIEIYLFLLFLSRIYFL